MWQPPLTKSMARACLRGSDVVGLYSQKVFRFDWNLVGGNDAPGNAAILAAAFVLYMRFPHIVGPNDCLRADKGRCVDAGCNSVADWVTSREAYCIDRPFGYIR